MFNVREEATPYNLSARRLCFLLLSDASFFFAAYMLQLLCYYHAVYIIHHCGYDSALCICNRVATKVRFHHKNIRGSGYRHRNRESAFIATCTVHHYQDEITVVYRCYLLYEECTLLHLLSSPSSAWKPTCDTCS